MATFSLRYPGLTFKGLLNIDNNNSGIDATLRTVQDGEGTECPLQLSTTYVNITALKYNGNIISIAGAFTLSGAYAFTGTLTGATTVTFPVTGTLATLAGTETFTNKTLTTPSLTNPTVSTGTFTSPTLVTPALGTPASGNLSACTNYPESSITFTDITTNDVSTTKHGFTPKLPNDSTKFLDGTGAWAVPIGGSYGGAINTFLNTPSSANLAAAVTDEIGYSTGHLLQFGYQAFQQWNYAATSSSTTDTVHIPADNTTPQNTEGTQILSLAYAARSTTNRLVITVNCTVKASALDHVAIALFQSGSASAIQVKSAIASGTDYTVNLTLVSVYTPGTTSSKTYSVRMGCNTYTATLNPELYGLTQLAYITIQEYTA